MVILCSFIFAVSFLSWSAESAKILFVASMPAYSHFTLAFRLSKEMADRGHQVTVINPYPQKSPIKNYKDVSVEELLDFAEEFKKNLLEHGGFLSHIKGVLDLGVEIAERTYANKNVQELLNSGEKFDAVVVSHFVNDALVGIAHHFDAPLVILSPVGSGMVNNYLMANPAPSSYVPNMAGSFTKHMNFWQRVANFLLNFVTETGRAVLTLREHRSVFKKYIKTDAELDDVLFNASLMLTNSHVSINDAVPRVPSIVEIGGFHLHPPKPLPEDLKTFLDNSPQGVVLFSMGSNLKSKDLKPEARDAILQAFAKIKQQVLWKFEADLPNLPSNVKIMKWLPQQDILAHPNIRAFISHGGGLSTIETVYHGVPIIGIPVFGDQRSNIANAVNKGYAVVVPLDQLTEAKLSWALNEVLNNPRYRENIQERSSLMRDQPLKPIDSAVYWLEHVIRHKGAPHLRSAGLDLKWYQRDLVDVFAFLLLLIISLSASIYFIVRTIIEWVTRKPTKISRHKKNK